MITVAAAVEPLPPNSRVALLVHLVHHRQGERVKENPLAPSLAIMLPIEV
jgi:hypothetical protein